MTFSFGTGLSAFGIDIDTSATTGAYSATTNLGDIIASVSDPFPGFSTGNFVGFSSDTPFTSVTISANTGFTYTLDTLRAVPEPGTLALAAFALLAAAGWSRRRAAQA